MDHRSPLESIFGIIGGLPQGHDKPVKHALYNAVALLLLFLCCAATWALFMILEPFVKPLIWALLVGSVLHPLKRSLRDKFQTWFESLEVSHTPIVLGVVLLPINIVNDLSDFIGDQLLKRIKFIISVCVAIPVILLIYNYTPKLVVCIFYKAYIYSCFILNFCLENASQTLVCYHPNSSIPILFTVFRLQWFWLGTFVWSSLCGSLKTTPSSTTSQLEFGCCCHVVWPTNLVHSNCPHLYSYRSYFLVGSSAKSTTFTANWTLEVQISSFWSDQI